MKRISIFSLLAFGPLGLLGQTPSETMLMCLYDSKTQTVTTVRKAVGKPLTIPLLLKEKPVSEKQVFDPHNYPFAIHQSFVLPDDKGLHLFPMLGLEFGLLRENQKNKFRRNYICLGSTYSPGLSKYSGYRAYTLKAGFQRGWLEANYGIYLFKDTNREIPPFAFQLGLRSPNKNSKVFFRIGIGAPEILYSSIGIAL